MAGSREQTTSGPRPGCAALGPERRGSHRLWHETTRRWRETQPAFFRILTEGKGMGFNENRNDEAVG